MRRIIHQHSILVTPDFARGPFGPFGNPQIVRPGAAVGTCARWVTQLLGNDVVTANGSFHYSQKIKNTSGTPITICAVKLWIQSITGGNPTVKLWADASEDGTQFGGESDGFADDGDICSFTWAANPVIPANTDFFVSLNTPVGASMAVVIKDTDVYQNGTSYSPYRNATQQPAFDLYFEVWTLQ